MAARNKELFYFLLLAFIFLLTGIVGHDPWWKRGETYSFGLIYHFYKTGTWLIPTNAGIPFMEKPPLYYWTGRLTCNLFGSVLPLHDAARIVSVFYMSVTVLFLWLSGRALFRLYPPEKQSLLSSSSVFLFLSTYGISLYGHVLSTDIALMAGTAITLYGIILLVTLPEQWKQAGLFTGLGIGITFLSKGLALPTILGLSGLLISFLSPYFKWQRHTIKGTLLAAIIALPFCLIWPVMVYRYSPELFHEWFWDNNLGRFLGYSVPTLGAETHRLKLFYMLPVFGFPIFPLACYEIMRGRHEWHRTDYLLPVIISAVGIFTLLVSASFRTIYLLPLFPGFCLLAAQGLMRLDVMFLSRWNRFVRVAFTVTAIGVWVIWWNLLHPIGARPIPWLVHYYDHVLPRDFLPDRPQPLELAVALLVTVFWILSFRLKDDAPQPTVRIFFTGAMLIWCTSHTLLMPWINETKSFRSTVRNFQEYLAHSPYKNTCIANYQLGENMAPMLEYFMNRDTPLPIINIDDNNTTCPIFLTFVPISTPQDFYAPHWKMVWHGTPLLDIKDSELRLYEQTK